MLADTTKRLSLPIRVEIAKPCPASWDEMDGDHKSRFCHSCKKHVYNLIEYSDDEVREFLAKGNVCGRVYQRTDGTILTADCPVGVKLWRQKLHRLAFISATTAVMVMTGAAMAIVNLGKQRVDKEAVTTKVMGKVTNWLNPPVPPPKAMPPGTMVFAGAISPPRPPVMVGDIAPAKPKPVRPATKNRPATKKMKDKT